MSNPQLFHRHAVAIDPERHAQHGVVVPRNQRFAAGVNSLPLLVPEFSSAAGNYPIVIVRDARQRLMPVALLGLRSGENLFVEATGHWSEDAYLPALIRRYPFTLGKSLQSAEPVVHVEASCLVTQRGEQLFKADESPSDYYQGVRRFVLDCQRELARARRWCARLDALSLLRRLTVRDTATGQRAPGSFLVVDERRLQGLADQELAALCRNGDMQAIVLHVYSLQSMRHLFDRAAVSVPIVSRDVSTVK